LQIQRLIKLKITNSVKLLFLNEKTSKQIICIRISFRTEEFP
jgi:hypothetical protein